MPTPSRHPETPTESLFNYCDFGLLLKLRLGARLPCCQNALDAGPGFYLSHKPSDPLLVYQHECPGSTINMREPQLFWIKTELKRIKEKNIY